MTTKDTKSENVPQIDLQEVSGDIGILQKTFSVFYYYFMDLQVRNIEDDFHSSVVRSRVSANCEEFNSVINAMGFKINSSLSHKNYTVVVLENTKPMGVLNKTYVTWFFQRMVFLFSEPGKTKPIVDYDSLLKDMRASHPSLNKDEIKTHFDNILSYFNFNQPK